MAANLGVRLVFRVVLFYTAGATTLNVVTTGTIATSMVARITPK
jgi:hypothetical protein